MSKRKPCLIPHCSSSILIRESNSVCAACQQKIGNDEQFYQEVEKNNTVLHHFTNNPAIVKVQANKKVYVVPSSSNCEQSCIEIDPNYSANSLSSISKEQIFTKNWKLVCASSNNQSGAVYPLSRRSSCSSKATSMLSSVPVDELETFYTDFRKFAAQSVSSTTSSSAEVTTTATTDATTTTTTKPPTLYTFITQSCGNTIKDEVDNIINKGGCTLVPPLLEIDLMRHFSDTFSCLLSPITCGLNERLLARDKNSATLELNTAKIIKQKNGLDTTTDFKRLYYNMFKSASYYGGSNVVKLFEKLSPVTDRTCDLESDITLNICIYRSKDAIGGLYQYFVPQFSPTDWSKASSSSNKRNRRSRRRTQRTSNDDEEKEEEIDPSSKIASTYPPLFRAQQLKELTEQLNALNLLNNCRAGAVWQIESGNALLHPSSVASSTSMLEHGETYHLILGYKLIESFDKLLELPNEILSIVLSFLDDTDVLSFSLASKHCYKLAEDGFSCHIQNRISNQVGISIERLNEIFKQENITITVPATISATISDKKLAYFTIVKSLKEYLLHLYVEHIYVPPRMKRKFSLGRPSKETQLIFNAYNQYLLKCYTSHPNADFLVAQPL